VTAAHPEPLRTEEREDRFATFAGISVGAFLALCVFGLLVADGQLSGIDTYAIRNLMPFGSAFTALPGSSRSILGLLIAYPTASFHLGGVIRVPASAGVSSLLAVVFCSILWRRGRRGRGLLWLVAFGVANVVEGFGKLVIKKPTMYAVVDGSLQPAGFYHSFPSGHIARAAVLAAIATAVWPRLWWVFSIWVVAVVVSAELDSIHTPSDIAGGLLLATAVIFAVLAVQERWEATLDAALSGLLGNRRRPSPAQERGGG
jgi:membrane-associated phospholipid phosphatase